MKDENYVTSFIESKSDIYSFVRDNFIDIMYLRLYAECSAQPNEEISFEHIVERSTKRYESIFKLNMKLNRFTEICDKHVISNIVREAAKIFIPYYDVSNEKLVNGIIDELVLKRKEGAFAIDCHVHTSDGSGCAHSSIENMIEQAIATGLDAIIITEHEKLTPQWRIDSLNKAYSPFRIFSGIEIRIDGDDFLVIGIQDEGLQKGWSYPDLYQFVQKNNGFIALAHPLRYWNGINANILTYRPDALELYSNNMRKYETSTKQSVLELANSLGTNIIANSDAHSVNDYCYCNELYSTPKDEADLVALLKDGEYRLKSLVKP